jgi:uncharacterized protein YciI
MTEAKQQAVYYVVFLETGYTSFEEAIAKAPDLIAAHKARSAELHNQGTILMAGAFLDNRGEPLSTMAVCASREAAEEFVRGDPFVLNGMVSKWYIREWANLFA